MSRKRGFLVVVSGPSGTGKNSILSRLGEEIPDLRYSISATTRPKRDGEIDLEHYFFLTKEEFLEKEEKGEFIETAEFCGHLYGTPKAAIEEVLSLGVDVVMDIETKGAKQVKTAFPDAVMIFLMPPSFEELRKRLELRGKDSKEVIEKRLILAEEEAKEVFAYDYVVINDDLNMAVEKIASIIRAQRCRIDRNEVKSFVKYLGDIDKKRRE